MALESISFLDYFLARLPAAAPANDNTLLIHQNGQILQIEFGSLSEAIAVTLSAPDTGTPTELAIAPTPALTAHLIYRPITFKANNTNTGACTIAINALGAVSIKMPDGTDPMYGCIRKNGIYQIVYNGATYCLINPSTPVGQIRMKIQTAASSGELKINGVLLDRVAYADLWGYAQLRSVVVTEAAWTANSWGAFSSGNGATTFRIPYFMGEFPRFYDDGRGIDAGRAMGAWQADLFKSHEHNSAVSLGAIAASGLSVNAVNAGNTSSTGGIETRPRNLPLLPLITF